MVSDLTVTDRISSEKNRKLEVDSLVAEILIRIKRSRNPAVKSSDCAVKNSKEQHAFRREQHERCGGRRSSDHLVASLAAVRVLVLSSGHDRVVLDRSQLPDQASIRRSLRPRARPDASARRRQRSRTAPRSQQSDTFSIDFEHKN